MLYTIHWRVSTTVQHILRSFWVLVPSLGQYWAQEWELSLHDWLRPAADKRGIHKNDTKRLIACNKLHVHALTNNYFCKYV